MIGTYHYTSDYGTGRLMIEATEDGIDISDYESGTPIDFWQMKQM